MEYEQLNGRNKAQREHTCWRPKRHIPLMSLLLNGGALLLCLMWVRQAVRLKFELAVFKNLYPATCKHYMLFVMAIFA